MTDGAVRQRWILTQEAFDKLLLSFGDDRNSGGQKYLEIRSNLTRFFEWRGCPFPEDHADETINRIAKRVWEGEQIQNPAGYAMGVARLLVLEIMKGRQREQVAMNEITNTTTEAHTAAGTNEGEERIECLRHCLGGLSTENRQLITDYYEGEKGNKIQNRKKLVEKLGIPVNTLRMRALRLRDRLQVCVEDCLARA
jgi:DNA-directed RNA polymerase specialized sigma24 family protein